MRTLLSARWKVLFRTGICLGCVAAVLSACSTDVEVNAPYRERAAIYALLNSEDTVHYIRIQRTFLTIEEPDAYKAAQVKDCVYYTEDDILDGRLYLREGMGARILLGRLERVDSAAKIAGVFYGPDQLVYRFRGRIIPEDSAGLARLLLTNPKALEQRRVRLEVSNRKTGYQASAECPIVYPIFNLSSEQPPVRNYWLRLPVRIGNTRMFPARSPEVSFGSNLNGIVFKIIVYIPFVEKNIATGERDTLEVPWTFINNQFDFNTDGRTISQAYKSPGEESALYDHLLTSIDTTNIHVTRYFLPLKIHIAAADSGFAQYVLAGSQYSVITQTKPLVTNIENGLGLLACRNEKEFQATLDSAAYGILLRPEYLGLRFRRP